VSVVLRAAWARLSRFWQSLRFRVAAIAALVFALAITLVLSATVYALWLSTSERVTAEAKAASDVVVSQLTSTGTVGASPWEPTVPMQFIASSGDAVLEGTVSTSGGAANQDGVALNVDTSTSVPPTDPADPPPLGDPDPTTEPDAEPDAEPPAPAAPASSYAVEVRRPSGADQGFVRVSRDAEVAGAVWEVTVVAALDSPASTIEEFSEMATRAVPGLVVAFALLVWLLVGVALRQVESVRGAAAAMSGSGSGQRLPVPRRGRDEIVELTDTFNSLLDRIDVARRHQQQFVSDASHELRSPIATIRALCEVAETTSPSSEIVSFAHRVDSEARRLDLLVADLLELARVAEGSASPLEEVDLDELVLAEAERVPPHVSVDVAGVHPVRVLGPQRRWEMVVRNLIGNAGRYADSAVFVTLSVQLDGPADADGRRTGTVFFDVCDDGPGVPAEDRERVFGRFVRLDEGRARDAGGTGLGLAVVSDVMSALGGERGIDDCGEHPGARFWVAAPVTVVDADDLDDDPDSDLEDDPDVS
jgi:signal transduction histidine kinase